MVKQDQSTKTLCVHVHTSDLAPNFFYWTHRFKLENYSLTMNDWLVISTKDNGNDEIIFATPAHRVISYSIEEYVDTPDE